MKTRNEMFAEFQREFDKKRLKELWGVILFLEAILAMIGACFVIAIFMPDSKIDDIRLPFFVLGGMAILFLLLGFIMPLFQDKHNKKSEFNANIIKKRLTEQKAILSKEYSDLEKAWEGAKKLAESAKVWADLFPNASELRGQEASLNNAYERFNALGLDPQHGAYLLAMLKLSTTKFNDLDAKLQNLANKIIELTDQIDFYDEVSERTYWHYLKSFKWLKRIK